MKYQVNSVTAKEQLANYNGCVTKVRVKFPDHKFAISLNECVVHYRHPQFQAMGRATIVIFSRYSESTYTNKALINCLKSVFPWLEKRLNNWSEALTKDNAKSVFIDFISYCRNELRLPSERRLANKTLTGYQDAFRLFLNQYLQLDKTQLIDGITYIQRIEGNHFVPPTETDAEAAFRHYLAYFENFYESNKSSIFANQSDFANFIHSFCYLLIAVTGMNPTQAFRLPVSVLTEAGLRHNQTRDPRIKVVKARAKYAEQEFEYPLWFHREVVSKFLKIVENYKDDMKNLGDFDEPSQMIDHSASTFSLINQYHTDRYSIPHIVPSEWRKFKGHFVSKRFGHRISAMILQHSEDVAHKNYRSINEIEAQAEMGKFFRFQEDLRSRLQNNSLEKANRSIPAGQCGATSEHDRPDHLKPAAQSFYVGDCKTPAGCLYCTHYVAHADEEDFWKLESLRFHIGEMMLRETNIEHAEKIHGSILNRIELITSTLREKPNGDCAWQIAKAKVSKKNLHPVWKRILTTQILLGRLDQ